MLMLSNLREDTIIADGKPATGLRDNAQNTAKGIRDAGGKAKVVAGV
ncbi:MAG: hypothetical protein ACJAUW_000668 [Yoonia sp.]|jgi:hypothetical protein